MIFCSAWILTESLPARASIPPANSLQAQQEARRLDELPPLVPHGKASIDRSGRKQKGKASWYGPGFAHKLMANGDRMNPHSNIAASKTLPLGTTAKVVNLKNGKSATVKIEDRGPFVDGRVVDVSPKVANELGLKKVGVAPVVVKPIAVPLPDGKVKLGAGAAGLPPKQVEQATRTTKALAGGGSTETAER
ncbi:MAG TPA: septal ring lytic transglycosylase RlpA family protein [Acetobacteraceae bacterium]|nr:septal ring lytic transglycosylase RlpA family protein [Acetobacteraceae bacterium]